MSFYKVFILVLTSFVLGAIGSQSMSQNNTSDIYIPFLENTASTKYSFKNSLDTVYKIIEENYYGFNTVDKDALTQALLEGLVQGLGDDNSEFFNPVKKERFLEGLSGDFEGIGAVVETAPQGVRVQRLLQGGPALESGIRAGDIILTANDVALADLDLFDAVENIRGPAGSLVVLEIIREGVEAIISKDIIRQKIQIPSVDFRMIEDRDIGYIILNQFGEQSSREFQDALRELQNNNPVGLIIDLRNNGGGFLESAVEILSEFIPRGEKLVSIRYRDSRYNTTFRSNNTGNTLDIPIVVLINENSASAAEITAGALREYNRAIIIGKKSFGKGSVQQPFEVEDSLLKLTVAHWYTPLGRSIETEGIEPDIEVELTEDDFENAYDRQLEEAKRLLDIFIEKQTLGLTIEEFRKTQKSSEDLGE